jgi:hypothetical protein
MADPAEHDRLWRDVIVAQAPVFGGYEKRAGRTIPIAILTPAAATA